MNKKYLIGALLLIGGYIAYKKFFVKKDSDASDSGSEETPVNRGVVAPPIPTQLPNVVSESAPTLVVPTTTTEMVKNKLVTKENVATASQNLPSNFTYAGLGKY